MKKIVVCNSCKRPFSVEGPASNTKLVEDKVTCPHCGHPNEVEWPLGQGFEVKKL